MTQCPKHLHWDWNTDCWQCFKESEASAFDVSPEFIEGQKKIPLNRKLVKPSKFSPYTRSERERRRNEVARLHFEKGLPGLKIAEMMKVDKNTVYADLKAVYRELARPETSTNDAYARFYVRLEMQRGRLEEYLSKEGDVQVRLTIERQLTDIESRLLQAEQRIHDSHVTLLTKTAASINDYCEEQSLDFRVLNLLELVRVSPDGYSAYMKVLKRERVIQ